MRHNPVMRIRFLIRAGSALALAGLALADPAPPPAPAAAPAWQATVIPPGPGAFAKLAPCALDYRVSWKGLLDAGSLRFEFGNPANAKSGAYVVTSAATSMGAAAALYSYKHWFWSELDPSSLQPKLFHTTEDLDDKRVTHSVRYSPKNVHCDQTTHVISSGKDYSRGFDFAYGPVNDPFSAMLAIRGQKLADGDTLALVVQPGENPYLVNLTVNGHEVHEGRKAIRLTMIMRKIDPASFQLLPYKKLKKATLWLSDDDDRIPLEVRAGVFIGDVRVTLSGVAKY